MALGSGLVVAPKLQRMAFGVDVLVILGIPFKISAGPASIVATGLVEDRNVWRNFAINQPAQHWSRAVGGIRDQSFLYAPRNRRLIQMAQQSERGFQQSVPNGNYARGRA